MIDTAAIVSVPQSFLVNKSAGKSKFHQIVRLDQGDLTGNNRARDFPWLVEKF